jgi:hypothetical protein
MLFALNMNKIISNDKYISNIKNGMDQNRQKFDA